MARVPQSQAELQKHLDDQLDFLRDACNQYDSGKENRAKQIAAGLRVLFHDTRNSKSLLGQLGQISSRKWLDSAGPIAPMNLMGSNNLAFTRVTMTSDDGDVAPSYVPVLGDYAEIPPLVARTAFGTASLARGTFLEFDRWWGMIVIDDKQANFSRSDLVLAVANQDGGSHVDPAIEETYQRLTRMNSMGFMAASHKIEAAPFDSPVPAALRQIAFETLESIDRQQ
jgi:hypothetical protein